jgi:predicted DNA-binding transcriptional regulator YafY
VKAEMARGDQLARQWKIIQTLIASRRGKSAPDLAKALGCHPRTVYRDLEALQVAGFPIYTEKIGAKSLWSLLDSARHSIPIPFSLSELMALYFSRGMMRILRNTVFYDSLETLFAKVKATLSPEYLQYLDQIEYGLEVGTKPYKPYGELKDLINQITQAAVQKKYIEIEYYTMSRKKNTRRKVAPYKIWYFDGAFYLVGDCGLREDVRIFALDRIKSFQQIDEHFETPSDLNIEEFMKSSFGVFHGEPVSVKIWFDADIAGYIREKQWHETQSIQLQEDGSIVFEATVAGTEEIKHWIMNWGSNAVVLSPESLRAEIRTEAAKMLDRYHNNEILAKGIDGL